MAAMKAVIAVLPGFFKSFPPSITLNCRRDGTYSILASNDHCRRHAATPQGVDKHRVVARGTRSCQAHRAAAGCWQDAEFQRRDELRGCASQAR